MIGILVHTPVWVFVLFAFLLFFGLKQSVDRKVKQLTVLLLPVAMIFLSLAGVATSFGLQPILLVLWIAGLCAVAILIYGVFPLKNVYYVKAENKYFVPGSFVPLVVIMAIFFTKYTIGVLSGFNADILTVKGFVYGFCLLYGAYSGYFAIRAVCILSSHTAAE